MKDLLQWWSPLIVNNQWVLAALGAGLGVLLIIALVRAAWSIREYGFLNYVKSTFRIEGETWRVIGILLLVAVAIVMMYGRP